MKASVEELSIHHRVGYASHDCVSKKLARRIRACYVGHVSQLMTRPSLRVMKKRVPIPSLYTTIAGCCKQYGKQLDTDAKLCINVFSNTTTTCV
jgi:hypothetical protein